MSRLPFVTIFWQLLAVSFWGYPPMVNQLRRGTELVIRCLGFFPTIPKGCQREHCAYIQRLKIGLNPWVCFQTNPPKKGGGSKNTMLNNKLMD